MKIKNVDQFLENASILAIGFAQGVIYPALCLAASAAIIGGGLLLCTVEKVGVAELNTRPSFESSGKGLLSFSGKVAQMGEFDAPGMSLTTYVKLIKEWQAMLPTSTTPRGFSFIDNDLRISKEHDVCVVSSRQHGDKVHGFYDFSATPYIAEKDKLDFFVQSHETSHCGFHIDAHADEGDESLRFHYLRSVQEVAADLGAILDYMRLTGTNDFYTDLVKPFRISTIEDLSHTTSAALDVILEDVNPESLKSAQPADIPILVNHLMAKHMHFDDVGYDIFKDGDHVDDHIAEVINDKPAALALIKEMSGRIEILREKLNDEQAVELRQKIKQTLVSQVDAYEGIVPDDLRDKVIENQNDLFLRLDLHEMELGYSEPRTAKINENLTGRGLFDYYVNSR